MCACASCVKYTHMYMCVLMCKCIAKNSAVLWITHIHIMQPNSLKQAHSNPETSVNITITWVQWNYKVPFGHSKHCPTEVNDTPSNSEQHWWKDIELSPTDSPPQ